jgi:hypothetical protein
MVFKFFKEMLGAFKEGIDEAKAEHAEEQAAEKQLKEQLDATQAENFASLTPKEIFYTALGAPYRKLFVGDSAYDLSCMDVPEGKKRELAEYINRDFSVFDKNSLVARAMSTQATLYSTLLFSKVSITDENAEKYARFLPILENLEAVSAEELSLIRNEFVLQLTNAEHDLVDDKSRALIALWMSRLSYMTTSSVGLGFISKTEAFDLLQPFVEVGVKQIKDWRTLGALFIEGEKQDSSNNMVGRKILSMQVNKLLEDSSSPWLTQPWPENISTL